MDPVIESPRLPSPTTSLPEDLAQFAESLVVTLIGILQERGFRLNRVLPRDGTEPMDAPLTLETYTTATRPAAASYAGAIIYVSDAASGNKFQGSDGTSWVSLG